MREPDLESRSKEVQRDVLVARLNSRAAAIAGRGGRIVAVFDAHAALGVESHRTGTVTVAFAASADDEIVRRCRDAGTSVVVYTDDLRLRMRISQDVGRHVEYRDVSSLFAHEPVGPRGTRGSRSGMAADKALGKKAREDITAELEGLWLDDEE